MPRIINGNDGIKYAVKDRPSVQAQDLVKLCLTILLSHAYWSSLHFYFCNVPELSVIPRRRCNMLAVKIAATSGESIQGEGIPEATTTLR